MGKARGLTIFLIAFTPLREYIPGYADVTLSRRVNYLLMKTDSLEAVARQKNAYINNINMIIDGTVGMGYSAASLQDQPGVDMDNINYTEQMTKDILQYVRDIEILDSEVEIVELVDSIIETISVPENIEISKKYNVASESINVDVELFNRALGEIIKNSIAAIEHKKGKVTIELGIKVFKNIFIKNKFLVLKIEDNGKGINDDFQNLVKEPFFTTRKSEYHSGLGLTIANKIIEAHGGQIRIENSRDNKTVVTIYLPMQEKENE